MHFVYLIKSLKNGTVYIGNTDDVAKRLREHNSGKNFSTKNSAPYQVIYYEAYKDKKDATVREYKLKHHGSSMGHLKKRVTNSLDKITAAPKGGV